MAALDQTRMATKLHHAMHNANRAQRTGRAWKVQRPERTECVHGVGGQLCRVCDRLLDRLVADLPGLLLVLREAWLKDVTFVQRGWRAGDGRPDEASLPWSPAAGDLFDELAAVARRRDWMVPADRAALLEELSGLAERAHRIVDRPPDRQWTVCPSCGATVDAVRGRQVVCRAVAGQQPCSYRAGWQEHQRNLLDGYADQLLTCSQLVGALTVAGEPISRQRISYLVKRHGLERLQVQRPAWREGRIVTEPTFVYRLGDVRSLQEWLSGGPKAGPLCAAHAHTTRAACVAYTHVAMVGHAGGVRRAPDQGREAS